MITKPDNYMKKDLIPNLPNPDTKDLREQDEKLPNAFFVELMDIADNAKEDDDESTQDKRFYSLKKVLHLRYKKFIKGENEEDDDKSKIEDLNERELEADGEQNEFKSDDQDLSESSEQKVP